MVWLLRPAQKATGLRDVAAEVSAMPVRAPIANRKNKARDAARKTAWVHVLLQVEASNPAASAHDMALRSISTESTISARLSPPSRNGTAITGRTAIHSVNARNPCATPSA